MPNASTHETIRTGTPSASLVLLAFLGFISLGLPDAAIGVAWPSIRDTYQLRQPALGLLLVVSGLGYLASSFTYGRFGRSWQIGWILCASTAMVGLAMLGFACSPWWSVVLLCSCLHGVGSGAIDSGLNGYAAQHLPARHVLWLHAFYCAGVISGPLVMASVFARGQTYRQGYFWIALLLLTLSLIFRLGVTQWKGVTSAASSSDSSISLTAALGHRIVRLQILAFFLYTGLEVAVSQWTYTILTEHRGVSSVGASAAVALYWAGLLCGRLLLGNIVETVGCDRLVRYSLLGASIGGILFAGSLFPIEASLFGLGLVGLGFAAVFPCLMTRTLSRLGQELATAAVGLQVGCAMSGGAVVPGITGMIADRWGLATASGTLAILMIALFLLHEVLLVLPRPQPEQDVAVNQPKVLLTKPPPPMASRETTHEEG
ncbi:MFS transporter [Schlesneria sp. T3-172]|uniref:MFS transporter n=1 Tax=Schlesneria sphaerica TaxID=3373610 RepID=UPI0037C4FEB9